MSLVTLIASRTLAEVAGITPQAIRMAQYNGRLRVHASITVANRKTHLYRLADAKQLWELDTAAVQAVESTTVEKYRVLGVKLESDPHP